MASVQCEKGLHFYNSDKFDKCPYCGISMKHFSESSKDRSAERSRILEQERKDEDAASFTEEDTGDFFWPDGEEYTEIPRD